MRDTFLIGGGRDEEQIVASHAPFVRAAGTRGPIVAYVLDEGEATDLARWSDALRLAGADEVDAVVIGPDRPPHHEDLAGAAGVFVAGGWTPGYQEAFAAAGDWLRADLPYAGFSAGAAIAAEDALVGGWRIGDLAVCAEEAGEDLEQVEPRAGLGLVPFAVDVHATQWGTLTRVVHAVAAGLVDEGWAVDEGTVLIIEAHGARPRVEGLGCAYEVVAEDHAVLVTAHTA